MSLVELLAVVALIGIVLGLLVPSLGIGAGRALEGDTREFLAQIENARQIAIAERTRTRVLIPVTTSGSRDFGRDLALRAYAIASLNRSSARWRIRTKWYRLPDTVGFRNVLPTAAPAPFIDANTEENILATRGTATTEMEQTSSSGTPLTFTGAYIEFRPNGAASLSPADLRQVVVLADGFVDRGDAFVPKNRGLFYEVSIDPLTGSARF